MGGEEWGSAVGLGFRSAWGVKWCGGGWASELAGWAIGPVGQGVPFFIYIYFSFLFFYVPYFFSVLFCFLIAF